MDDVVRHTRRRRAWRAWAGDLTELQRIIEIAEESCESRVRQILADHEQHKDGQFCGCDRWAGDLVPRAYLSEGPNETVSGPPRQVVSQLDRRTFKGLTIKATSSGDHVELRLQPTSNSAGVTLEATSSDQAWLRQTFAELSDEIDKGQPRWHWVRSVPALFLLLNFAISTSLFALWPLVASGKDGLIALALVLSMLVIPMPLPWVAMWAFPAFEITTGGAGSTGSRRLSFLIALALSVPIGIVVNQVS